MRSRAAAAGLVVTFINRVGGVVVCTGAPKQVASGYASATTWATNATGSAQWFLDQPRLDFRFDPLRCQPARGPTELASALTEWLAAGLPCNCCS
jgi:hypothetical protein